MAEATDTMQSEGNIWRQNTDYLTYSIYCYYQIVSLCLYLLLLRLVSATILVHLREASKFIDVHNICGILCEKDGFCVSVSEHN
jgi:hypothetical protein